MDLKHASAKPRACARLAASGLLGGIRIFEYKIEDLMFAHWMKRKREMMAEHKQIPAWLESELDKLRPLRNPSCSIFVLDDGPLYAV